MTQSIELTLLQGLLSLFVVLIGALLSAFIPKLKQMVDAHLSAKQALVANQVMDGLAKISEAVVQDFNQRVVADAKANGVFSPLVAASVKKDAVNAVMSQSGALRTLGSSTLGDVEGIIGSLIEQVVLKNHISAGK